MIFADIFGLTPVPNGCVESLIRKVRFLGEQWRWEAGQFHSASYNLRHCRTKRKAKFLSFTQTPQAMLNVYANLIQKMIFFGQVALPFTLNFHF